MNAKDIVTKIDERFFKKGEADKAKEEIKKILNDFFGSEKLETTTDDIIEFLKQIWTRFSIGKYVDVFVDFAKAEKALYGFAENYRDHLMHLFNIHVMGLIIFSKLLEQEEKKVFKLLKIEKESDNVPFPSHYDKPRRLYYLWCLSSTFHDIAIPIDYRKRLVKGLGKYLDYFKIETEEFYLKFPFMTPLDINRYSDNMSKLFASGIVLLKNANQPTYQVDNYSASSYLYFRSVLSCAMNMYDHGVLGSYFLFRSIEELFLCGRNLNLKYDLDLCALETNGRIVDLPADKKKWDNLLLEEFGEDKEKLEKANRKYDFTRGETKTYNDHVLRQDVTRAALAIALHNINPDENPKIFPLKFSEFPLACLLILLDELQEFYRPEEVVLTEVVRCREFPVIDIKQRTLNSEPHIQIKISFDLEKPSGENEIEIINKYNEMLKKDFKTYDELVRYTWNYTFEIIEKKIAFENKEPLEIWIKVTIEGKKPNGKKLEYKSPNWTDIAYNSVYL